MRKIRMSSLARQDLRGILEWSAERFGEDAMSRYKALIGTALRDLAADPDQPGRRPRPELGQGKRSRHLRLSRDRVRGDRVLSPRHIILYRSDDGTVFVVGIVHESMDIARRSEPGSGEL